MKPVVLENFKIFFPKFNSLNVNFPNSMDSIWTQLKTEGKHLLIVADLIY